MNARKRHTMEDVHRIRSKLLGDNDEIYSYLAVYDGRYFLTLLHAAALLYAAAIVYHIKF